MAELKQYTVSQITDMIKKTINGKFTQIIKITGELSNVKKSGAHVYVSLKDDQAIMNVAFWNQCVECSNGQTATIRGRLDYYGKTNNINLIGQTIQINDTDTTQSQYMKLKNKYSAMGYFNNARPLPTTADKIGMVTARSGAAIQDLLHVLEKNNYGGHIIVYDCVAQGDRCPDSVARGIRYFDTLDVDMIVVTRGGGSMEDLMGFSHPTVVQAIHESQRYVVSAVGHQTDNMLSDYVANYRAPTPSVAGEIISRIYSLKYQKIKELENKMIEIKYQMINALHVYHKSITKINEINIDPAHAILQKLHEYAEQAHNHMTDRLTAYIKKINDSKKSLICSDIQQIHEQGFVLFTDDDGNIISSIDHMIGRPVTIVHGSGNYMVRVTKME